VEEVMSPGPSTFRPSLPVGEMAEYLDEHELGHALVSTLDGRLVGVVRRRDLGGA
jgi:CBS domain-containing protein